MKKYTDTDVFQASKERIKFVFDEFEQVYVSFSGGKDSGVLINLALQEARSRGQKLNVLIVDLEAQYKATIDYILETVNQPDINAYWVCLPIHLRNAVSQIQPHWICWDKDKRDAWVRDYPNHPSVIKDESYFPFFRKGMEFEEFVPLFGEWLSQGKKTACLVGIRSDESLNRFRTIKNTYKQTYKDKMWTTLVTPNVYNAYPIYDWRTEDIWTANAQNNWKYNTIYDLMYLAGLSIHQMRLCQPYGDDQRKGLHLFKMLEPETWALVVNRVEGANFGARYVLGKNGQILGNNKIYKPEGHSWRSYTKFLLDTMPKPVSEHYRSKILVFLKWWRKHGKEYGVSSIPDDDKRKLNGGKYYPSWWRICKVIIKNDYWCKGLSFSPTKKQMEKHLDLISKYLDKDE